MTIGRYKGEVFLLVGCLLTFNYWLAIVRPRGLNCRPGEMCHLDSPAMRFNRAMFWMSVVIYASAGVLTYAALWWVRRQP
jgi:hypothetical protein